jgi:hypothetical protein
VPVHDGSALLEFAPDDTISWSESSNTNRVRVHCAPISLEGLIMELIIASFIAAVLLLVGHLGALVRNRLMAWRQQRRD